MPIQNKAVPEVVQKLDRVLSIARFHYYGKKE